MALLCAALLGAGPRLVAAQEWAVVDAVGYAGAGAGTVGSVLMIFWLDSAIDENDFFTGIAVGTGLGLAVGAVVGHRAESAVARGEVLGERQRRFVLVGGVLAGTTLGTGLALTHGCDRENESTCTGIVLAGTALGGLYTWWRSDTLDPRPLDVAPTVSPSGEVGFGIRITF